MFMALLRLAIINVFIVPFGPWRQHFFIIPFGPWRHNFPNIPLLPLAATFFHYPIWSLAIINARNMRPLRGRFVFVS